MFIDILKIGLKSIGIIKRVLFIGVFNMYSS